MSRGWVRLGMLAAALVLPALVGATALLLKDPGRRPRGPAATAAVVLKSYPFTLGLALTLVTMTVLAPVRKLQTLLRRWDGQHVPVMIDAAAYDAVVADVRQALAAAGWETERRPATWMLRLPTRILLVAPLGAALGRQAAASPRVRDALDRIGPVARRVLHSSTCRSSPVPPPR